MSSNPLREARRKRGLTQVELSRKAKVPQSSISWVEGGNSCGKKVAVKLVRVLPELSITWLLGLGSGE